MLGSHPLRSGTVRVVAFAALIVPVPLAAETPPPAKPAEEAAPAAPEVSREERRALQNAEDAYANGLFDIADQRLRDFLKEYPESPLLTRARLIEAQVLYHMGRNDEAVAILEPALKESGAPPTEMLFWYGENLLQAGRYPEAEKTYAALIEEIDRRRTSQGWAPLRAALDLLPFGKDNLPEEAALGLAWAQLMQDKTAEADKTLAGITDGKKDSRAGQAAHLLRARKFIRDGKDQAAVAQLELLLDGSPLPEYRFEAAYLLGEVRRQQGEHAEAIQAYEQVTGDKKAFPKNLLASAWLGQGQSHHEQAQFDEALAAFEKAYTLADDDQGVRLPALKRYLATAAAYQRLPEAIAKLQAYAQNNRAQPNTAAALYAIGEALAEDGQPNKAVGTLETLRVAYPGSRWRAPAGFLLGRIYEEQGQRDAALKALIDTLGEPELDPELARRAQFGIGRLLLARGNYDQAIERFREATKAGTATDDLAERAWYHMLLALARQGELDLIGSEEVKFAEAFPKSEYLDQIPLLKGRLQEQRGMVEAARDTYRQAVDNARSDQHKAQLLRRLGDLYMLTGQPGEALSHYQGFLDAYPSHREAPDVRRSAILAGRDAGELDEAAALAALLELYKEHPKSDAADDVLMSVADIYYARGDFSNAQTRFLQLAKRHPNSPLADTARYFGGISAARHGDLSEAIATLESIADDSPLKPDARLLQARLYHRQLKFDNALTLFDAILADSKQDQRHVEALLGRGACLYAMGENDPTKYELAAATFGKIVNGTAGDPAQRNEAGYSRATAFEKLGRVDDALDLYLNVLNGRLWPDENDAKTGQQVVSASSRPSDQVWQIKAGLQAARIKEQREDWRGAIRIYERLEELGGPNREQFRAMRNRLRRDHYIYD